MSSSCRRVPCQHFRDPDYMRHECPVCDASHSHQHISLSLYQGPSLSVDLKMVRGIKSELFARPGYSQIPSYPTLDQESQCHGNKIKRV